MKSSSIRLHSVRQDGGISDIIEEAIHLGNDVLLSPMMHNKRDSIFKNNKNHMTQSSRNTKMMYNSTDSKISMNNLQPIISSNQ